MATLYHPLGTSRILEGLVTCRGLVEPREGIGCGQCRSARLAGRSVTLQAVGPAAGSVVDARNLDFRVAHAVGNNVGRFGYHQFACAGDALCGGRIMFIDVSAQGEKIVNGFRRPVERHTPRGDRRSFRVSQEATHSLTRACAMPLPRSSEASARAMPETCHSLVSR
jgi:hypothetical protein